MVIGVNLFDKEQPKVSKHESVDSSMEKIFLFSLALAISVLNAVAQTITIDTQLATPAVPDIYRPGSFLFDLQGRTMAEWQSLGKRQLQLSVAGIPAGLYFVQLTKADGKYTSRKVLIQR